MSVCGQSGQPEEDSASEEVGASAREKPSDIYKQKPASKVVRVLTVLAYLLSVSLAAILLSVYYICVWKSPELPLSEPAQLSARRGNRTDYGYSHAEQRDQQLYIRGGSDTTVNGSTSLPPSNSTGDYNNKNVTDSASTPGDISTSDNFAESSVTVLPDDSTQELPRTTDVNAPFSSTENVT